MEHRKEEDDLQMALRMSLQSSPSDAKRSMPPEDAEESPEARGRRLRREIMAAAAEKRMAISSRLGSSGESRPGVNAVPAQEAGVSAAMESSGGEERKDGKAVASAGVPCPRASAADSGARNVDVEELSLEEANRLFSMLFGGSVSKSILMQWTNQGIRFSSDPETCMGLVQHRGGPCGVLAPIQAFILKYLLFFPAELDEEYPAVLRPEFREGRSPQRSPFTGEDFSSITEVRKTRALVLGMVEILFSCGYKKSAAVATLSVFPDGADDEAAERALEGVSMASGADLKRYLRVRTHKSPGDAYGYLMAALPAYRSRVGAVLFLISALLSRGLDSIQADRDDPSLPLVTSPFGHASQEIVNLLVCGDAAANVFDGRMDLGGGMFLRGIPGEVEVGFLTLLESLNYCKVGQFLKRPRWPIWVVGSESHYTVLFALDAAAQAQNDLERREATIRAAFDAHDQSGGGGFVAVDGFRQILKDAAVDLPADKVDALCAPGYIVWSEFWQALLELGRNHGGLKDDSGRMGRKQFDVFHFNGIAKSVALGAPPAAGGEIPMQRPRLCKLRVSVPPKWTQEEFMADAAAAAAATSSGAGEKTAEEEPSQHAPLVDCIRTRWPRASCSWAGDSPSIV